MIVAALKRAFSYLWDIQEDYRSSAINGDLVVFLSKGRYQLCTANAIYSYEDKYDNFANIFRSHFDFDQLSGQDVLVLGLGLGSVPIILDQIEPGAWTFIAVEIDEAVCELAALYGYPKIVSPIDTLIGDATTYVKECQVQYDMICIDIFIDDVMPSTAQEIEFLEDVRRCLKEGGVVIANTLAFSGEHRQRSKTFFEERFKAVFPMARLIHTHLNYMLMSDGRYLVNDPT